MTDDDKLLVLPLGEESKLITQTIANDTARQILELLADGAMSTSAIAKKLDIPLTTAQYNVEKLIEAKLVVVEKTKYSEKGREVKLYAPAKRMIVLVPANTTRQAVMDVLKKYLVLLPLAGFVALLIEVATGFRDGIFGLGLSNKAAETFTDSAAPQLTAQGGFGNATAGLNDTNYWIATGPGMPPAPNALANITGTVSGVAKSGAENFTGALRNNATDAINRTMESAGDVGASVPQAPATSTIAGGSWVADLFSHYGLWFFIGCALIIGILMTYELYRVRKGKKK